MPDRSRSGLTATINGGPAFLPPTSSWAQFRNYSASQTFSQTSGGFFFFTRTPGMNYLTANTSLFDWSNAASQFMIMAQCKYDNGAAAEITCLSWSDQNASRGWEIRIDASASGQWLYSMIDIGNLAIFQTAGSTAYSDTNMHTIGVWRKSSDYRFYFDGVLTGTLNNTSNMGTVAGGAPLAHGRAGKGGRLDWGGGIGRTIIWRKAIDAGQADAWFQQGYLVLNGKTND